jgi:hypothetical protein
VDKQLILFFSRLKDSCGGEEVGTGGLSLGEGGRTWRLSRHPIAVQGDLTAHRPHQGESGDSSRAPLDLQQAELLLFPLALAPRREVRGEGRGGACWRSQRGLASATFFLSADAARLGSVSGGGG